jgi:hypothetical protein
VAYCRSEAKCELVVLLETGTDHLTPSKMRRIIRAVRAGVKGSLDAAARIEEEMQLFAGTFPEADGEELRKRSEDTVLAFEEEISAWEQRRDEGELCDSNAESDSGNSPTAGELLQVLDGILAPVRAVKALEGESVDADRLQRSCWSGNWSSSATSLRIRGWKRFRSRQNGKSGTGWPRQWKRWSVPESM